MTERMIGITAAIVLSTLVGCGGTGRTIATGSAPEEVQAPTELVAKNQPPISDLPVPLKMSLDQDKSRSWSAPGVRVVMHEYTGRADKWAVGRFYKRQMPLKDWKLVADRMLRGKVILDFEKGAERCVIEISDARFGGSRVVAQIYPFVRGGQGR